MNLYFQIVGWLIKIHIKVVNNYMKSFYQFYIEITDVLSAPTDDIAFVGNDDLIRYSFSIPLSDERVGQKEIKYTIEFEKYPIVINHETITNDAYSRNLSTNLYGFQSTKLGNGPTVYRQLLKAVKKLIEEKNPEGLDFLGATTDQQIMYNTFYEKILNKYYTRVSNQGYIRNDLLKQWESTRDKRFILIKSNLNAYQPNDLITKLKKKKEEKRQIRMNINNLIGKIVWDSYEGIPVYIDKIIPPNQISIIGIPSYTNNKEINFVTRIENIQYLTDDQKYSARNEIAKLLELITKKYFKRPEIAV